MIRNEVVVLLSTYNGEYYLKDQLDSLLSQSVDTDILIRDDGSTDSTVSILQKYELAHKNIKVYYENNVGFVKSLFKLINNVSDKYLYYSFCDQDDVWTKEKLETAIFRLKGHNNEPAFYAACSYLVDDSMNIYGKTQIQYKEITIYNSLIQNIAPGHSQVINRSFFLLLKRDYQLENVFCPDIWITQIASVTAKIYFDNTPRTFYRQHSNNTLNYGKTRLLWVLNRYKRLKNKELEKVGLQCSYFLSIYGCCLSDVQKKDIQIFIKYQKNIFTRLIFCFSNHKFYRQRKIENIYFKLLYLIGSYSNINGEIL